LFAKRLVDAGEFVEARRVLRSPLDGESPLAGWADLVLARISLALDRPGEARDAARRASSLDRFPGSDEAVRLEAASLEDQQRIDEALGLLDGSESWSLRLEGARLALRADRRNEARQGLVRVVVGADEPADAERALDLLEEAFPDPEQRFTGDDGAGVFGTVERWIDENRPGPALRLLRAGRPAEQAPGTPREALLEAHALWRMGNLSEARHSAVRARNGAGETRDGGIYILARLDLARGRTSAWRASMQALAKTPGTSRWRLRALRDLAMAAEGAPSPVALARYRAYRLAAGDQADPTAMLREFWAAWEIRRWTEADQTLQRILAREDMPSGVRAAALYWAGRRLENLGRSEEAREGHFTELRRHFPNHYYAAVLERHLGLEPPDPGSVSTVPPHLDACGEGAAWVVAARQLASVGLWSDSADAYRAAIRQARNPCARSVAVEAMGAAEEAESASDALEFASLAVGNRDACPADAVPPAVWQRLFPVPSGGLVREAAEEQRLDPRFVAAVIRQESGFRPTAVSSAGARGLLQLMPAVGREWARRLGMSDFDDEQLFEPAVNLRLGTAYLRALQDRFPFPSAALAAYNSGPARVQRWLSYGPSEEAFVERIPIPETRLYVKEVLTVERLMKVAWREGLEPRDTVRKAP
jgi:soluble lytic murein transglycosylase-like protein